MKVKKILVRELSKVKKELKENKHVDNYRIKLVDVPFELVVSFNIKLARARIELGSHSRNVLLTAVIFDFRFDYSMNKLYIKTIYSNLRIILKNVIQEELIVDKFVEELKESLKKLFESYGSSFYKCIEDFEYVIKFNKKDKVLDSMYTVFIYILYTFARQLYRYKIFYDIYEIL